jgi:hypothetical protein
MDARDHPAPFDDLLTNPDRRCSLPAGLGNIDRIVQARRATGQILDITRRCRPPELELPLKRIMDIRILRHAALLCPIAAMHRFITPLSGPSPIPNLRHLRQRVHS